MIDNYFGLIGNLSLRQVDGKNIQAAAAQDLVHHFQLAGVLDIAFASGNAGQDRLGDIVFGRPKTACREYKGARGKLLRQDAFDFRGIVADRKHADDMDSVFFQSTGKMLGIGVQHLSNQDFVTDCDDTCLNHFV